MSRYDFVGRRRSLIHSPAADVLAAGTLFAQTGLCLRSPLPVLHGRQRVILLPLPLRSDVQMCASKALLTWRKIGVEKLPPPIDSRDEAGEAKNVWQSHHTFQTKPVTTRVRPKRLKARRPVYSTQRSQLKFERPA